MWSLSGATFFLMHHLIFLSQDDGNVEEEVKLFWYYETKKFSNEPPMNQIYVKFIFF